MADLRWGLCYWTAFRQTLGRPQLHVCRDGGKVLGAFIWAKRRALLSRATNAANDHVPAWSMAAPALDAALAGSLVQHVFEHVAVVDFGPLYEEGDFYQHLTRAAASGGAWCTSAPRQPEAVAYFDAPWSENRKLLPSKALSNTARSRRQLEQLGTLEFSVVSGDEQLQPLLSECFALEAQGWKGRTGSPIAAAADTVAFYTSLAHEYARTGALALYTLRLNGRLIAFEYCLRSGGRLDLLKISHAEDLERLSPGNVLRLMTYEHEVETRGQLRLHLGRVSEWKLRWGTGVQGRRTVTLYRPGFSGRSAFIGGPGLRTAAKNALERLGMRRPAASAVSTESAAPAGATPAALSLTAPERGVDAVFGRTGRLGTRG